MAHVMCDSKMNGCRNGAERALTRGQLAADPVGPVDHIPRPKDPEAHRLTGGSRFDRVSGRVGGSQEFDGRVLSQM